MAKTYTSALASLGFALLSGAALAAGDDYSNLTIDQLPEDGRVTITGTVDNVEGTQEFVLRDRNGNTINIDTENAQNLNEGDRVRVSGTMDSKFMGMGKEISSATVVVMDATDQSAQSNNQQQISNQQRMANQAASRDATLQYSNTDRDNGMYNGDNLNSAADGVQRGENSANTAAGYGAANQQNQSQQKSAIERLPEDGKVTVTGEVASVDRDDRSFTLRDNTGETIDVHTNQRLTIRAGDQVRVSGKMNDEVAGMGEEITSAEVQLIKR